MPIYEYVCTNCNHKFEAMRSFGDADKTIICAQCGSENTKRAISKCFSCGGGSEHTYSVTSSGGGCAGCSGGNCAHCGH